MNRKRSAPDALSGNVECPKKAASKGPQPDFTGSVKAKFTVLKNSTLWRYLHNRINCAAILPS
jgi:hypothetical protein